MIVTKLCWSFVAGAVSVSTLSVTAERFGSKVAGALGGFPSTIAATLLIIAYGEDSHRAVEIARQIPLLMSCFGFFLLVYTALAKKGLLIALAGSLSTWVVLALIPFACGTTPLPMNLSVCAVSLVTCYLLVEKFLRIRSQAGHKTCLSSAQIVTRLFCGGFIVSASVLLGSISGPMMGALMAAFPAVTVSTLIVVYQSGGAELSSAVAKSMMLSGMMNAALYTTSVTFLFPLFGPVIGSLLSTAVLIVGGLLTYKIVAGLR